MENDRPKVAVGVLIFKGGKILLGKRKGAHAANVYGRPGGHLEHLESFKECAQRETTEEAGIKITNIKFLCLPNFKEYAPKHYVDIGLVADWENGVPEVLEPDKCESWQWHDLENLPVPLFEVVNNYIEAYKTGKNHFDSYTISPYNF